MHLLQPRADMMVKMPVLNHHPRPLHQVMNESQATDESHFLDKAQGMHESRFLDENLGMGENQATTESHSLDEGQLLDKNQATDESQATSKREQEEKIIPPAMLLWARAPVQLQALVLTACTNTTEALWHRLLADRWSLQGLPLCQTAREVCQVTLLLLPQGHTTVATFKPHLRPQPQGAHTMVRTTASHLELQPLV